MSFALERRPLAEWFRRIDVWANVDSEADDFSPSTDKLSAWLDRLDAWHRDAIEGTPAPGGQERLLYERTLTLHGATPPRLADRIIRLGDSCLSNGVIFSAELHLTGAPEESRYAEQIATSGRVAGLRLPVSTVIDSDGWLRDVERLAIGGTQLTFVGDYARMRALGVSSSPVLAARAHRMERGGDAAPEPGGGCGYRFGLNVANDGDVFPCRGLIGVASARLAHIDDALGPAFLEDCGLDLASLAAIGPDALGDGDVCARHRAALLKGEAR